MSAKYSTSALESVRADRAEDATKPGLVDERSEADARFFTHLITVLSVSSGMVGVCLTAIGLIGILKSLSEVETIVDDLLAVAAMFFMIATLMSFLGMRTSVTKTWQNFGRVLDAVFCVGLVLVVIGTLLLTWVVI
jgi:hypothetical protein